MAPLCRLSARSNADVSRPVASAALQKRAVAFGLSALLSICSAGLPSAPADAALLQLPATETNNRYFLVRAGASAAENDRGVMLSNPVAKTSMDSGLSTPGKQVVIQETYPALKKLRACEDGCWIWPSITQRSYQTAEILAALFRVGRSNIVPEYSFLDQRGAGAWEGGRLVDVEHLLSDLDSGGADLRPPPGTDGTPPESANDVLVRVRQLMSITETQYSGSDVLIVSPDSDNLSVLQAAVLGFDLRSHRDFAFAPGEARELQLATEARVDFSGTLSCARPPACK